MKISSKYLCVILLCIGNTSVFGQSTFGRLKQKATGIAEKVIDKKTDELLEDKSGKKDNTRENPTEKVKKERVKNKIQYTTFNQEVLYY